MLPPVVSPNKIRLLRLDRGWTLKYLATQLKTSITQISLLERGKRTLTQRWMQRIANIFEIHPADLLAGIDNPFALTPEERVLITRYRTASEEARAAINCVSKALAPEADVASRK